MKKLLVKELRLAASPLSYLFILFGVLTFCPGYPILVGGFFVCLGIFQSFQASRESNDILYSVLLPIRKADTVKCKYIFCIFIEMCSFALSASVTLLRMTVFAESAVYRANALMTANLVYLGFLLVIFGCFNAIFVCGFFKTAYAFARPFIKFIIAAFIVVLAGEALFHFPGLNALNSFGFDNIGLQAACLIAGISIFILLTVRSEKRAEKHFEKIDL